MLACEVKTKKGPFDPMNNAGEMRRRATDAMEHKSRGFTLVEVLIVVVILGILAAIAYPSYSEQVRKSRRSDGKVVLVETAQRLERCYTEFNSYNHASCTVTFPLESVEKYYDVTAPILTASTYSLTATPKGVHHDADCTTLTLDHRNQRGATGNDPTVCW